MAVDKMKEILKHFPDLEDGWKEMEEKLKAEPAEMEMLSLKYREMLQRESSKESLVESEFTKAKRADSDLKVMKANEASEKIYMSPAGVLYKGDKQQCNDIEYTRTDAFIEKAIEYIITNISDMHTLGVSAKMDECIIKDFRKYMKGEEL